jgi:glycosyltransferase involved in cell wall biosynthesis
VSATAPTPLFLHVIPTAVGRGAQREARALVDRLEIPGRRSHRLLSVFAGPAEIAVDEDLGYDRGERQSTGFDPRVVPVLRRALARIRPSVLVAHGGDPLKYLVPAMAGRRLPLAYYATGTFGATARPLQVAVWRRLVGRADVVAAEGEEVLAECRSLLGVPEARSLLAPNGRDPAVFHPAADPVGPAADRPPVLAFVGALTEGKRPGRYLEVVGALRARGLAFDAIACGGGALADALAAPAAAAGVSMLGWRDDVAAVLREADIFVFTSAPTGEGMPGVLIEAGMTGLPTVACAVPGARTVIDDGTTGMVVDPGDLDAMVEAVGRLVEDRDLRDRMGQAARRRCTERFSLDAISALWASFLDPLAGPRPARR